MNESTFIDEEGRPVIRVERYSKQSQLAEWNVKDIWYRTRTPSVAEQNEENVVFIKHNFPVKEGKKWDGNSKNLLQTLQELYNQTTVPTVWDYEYVNVHEPYTINGFTFDSTVTVLQFDRQTPVALSLFAKEVYAKNVGLIHKEIKMHNILKVPREPKGSVSSFLQSHNKLGGRKAHTSSYSTAKWGYA